MLKECSSLLVHVSKLMLTKNLIVMCYHNNNNNNNINLKNLVQNEDRNIDNLVMN